MRTFCRSTLIILFIFTPLLSNAQPGPLKPLVLLDLQYLEEINISQYPFYRLLKSSLQAEGYDLELKLMPARRTIEMVRQGKADGLLARFDDQPGLIKMNEPLLEMSFFTYTDSTAQFESLCDKRGAMVLGHEGIRKILAAKLGCASLDHQLTFVYRAKQMALMLASGRVDYIAVPHFFPQYLAKYYPGVLKEASQPFFRGNLFLYLQPQHQELGARLAGVFADAKNNSDYPFRIQEQITHMNWSHGSLNNDIPLQANPHTDRNKLPTAPPPPQNTTSDSMVR
jgi:hypothetical protein